MTIRELPDDPGFARQVEQCELDAWLDLDTSAPGARQFSFHNIDGATLMLDGATSWPHSRILNLGVNRPATPDTIKKILDTTTSAGISTLSTEISPIARPGTLSRLVTQAGFVPNERCVVVARRTGAVEEPDEYFRIREATVDDRPAILKLMNDVIPSAQDWNIVMVSQVKRPQWRYHVAMEDGAICATAGTHIQGDVAWLSPVWVGEAFRNRGTQAALIAHSVRDAAVNGAQWVATSYPAAPSGRTRNYERLGFSIVYLRNRFGWKATDS